MNFHVLETVFTLNQRKLRPTHTNVTSVHNDKHSFMVIVIDLTFKAPNKVSV